MSAVHTMIMLMKRPIFSWSNIVHLNGVIVRLPGTLSFLQLLMTYRQMLSQLCLFLFPVPVLWRKSYEMLLRFHQLLSVATIYALIQYPRPPGTLSWYCIVSCGCFLAEACLSHIMLLIIRGRFFAWGFARAKITRVDGAVCVNIMTLICRSIYWHLDAWRQRTIYVLEPSPHSRLCRQAWDRCRNEARYHASVRSDTKYCKQFLLCLCRPSCQYWGLSQCVEDRWHFILAQEELTAKSQCWKAKIRAPCHVTKKIPL